MKDNRFNGKLFSIIVPVFNRFALIGESLDSVKAQTYRPIEIIVVDDGSTDDTADVIHQWAKQNEETGLKLEYVYQQNTGPAAARNRGIQAISGEYVQYLDSDDRLHPERLEILSKAFESTNADFIQTGFDGFDAETGEAIETHYGRLDHDLISQALMGVLWPNTLRSAFRRSLVKMTGLWNMEMTCFEDREYVERAIVLADKPIAIRDILASARRGGGKRVSDLLRSYEGRKFRILCEESLANNVRDRWDVSYIAKQAFASRLYGLGFRSNASGWPDHGKRCGEIAESMGVELDTKGKLRKLAWMGGRIGGLIYLAFGELKRILAGT
jgi:glycosyltransferase involved in cell wall biosynthesis